MANFEPKKKIQIFFYKKDTYHPTFSADATIFKEKKIAPENMEKPPSKLLTIDPFFFSTAKNGSVFPDIWKPISLFQCFLYLIQIFGGDYLCCQVRITFHSENFPWGGLVCQRCVKTWQPHMSKVKLYQLSSSCKKFKVRKLILGAKSIFLLFFVKCICWYWDHGGSKSDLCHVGDIKSIYTTISWVTYKLKLPPPS